MGVKGEIETLTRLEGRFATYNKGGIVGFIFSDKALYTLMCKVGRDATHIVLKKVYPNRYTTKLYSILPLKTEITIPYRPASRVSKDVISKLEGIAQGRIIGVFETPLTDIGLAVKEEGDHVSIAVVYAYE